MTETIARIRWTGDDGGDLIGEVGTAPRGLFIIWAPRRDDEAWEVTTTLPCAPSMPGERRVGADVDEAKAEAERWLEEFTSSLGAVFRAPELPPPSRGTMRDLTCGACGAEFGTNFHEDQIDCPECDARRCPHCGEWFGRDD